VVVLQRDSNQQVVLRNGWYWQEVQKEGHRKDLHQQEVQPVTGPQMGWSHRGAQQGVQWEVQREVLQRGCPNRLGVQQVEVLQTDWVVDLLIDFVDWPIGSNQIHRIPFLPWEEVGLPFLRKTAVLP